MYYKTRMKLHILLFVARPRPSNKRFRSTKIYFFDSGKKLRTDPRLRAQIGKKSKNKKSNTLRQYKAKCYIPTWVWQMSAPILPYILDEY